MDVFLGKQDGDAGCFVVDRGCIRLARVVHSGDTQGDDFSVLISVSSKEDVANKFMLQSVTFWSKILDTYSQNNVTVLIKK